MQPNGNDCGLFAIAFAMAICSGQAPEDLFFDVGKMRSHLSSCLKVKKMTPFPTKERNIKKRDSRRHESVPVYCNCRLMESSRIVCCDTCTRWYHGSCVVVPPQVWNQDTSILWTCHACTVWTIICAVLNFHGL